MKRARSAPRKLVELASTGAADPDVWELRLYLAGKTAKSVAAFENLSRLCEEHMAGKYRIEVVDCSATRSWPRATRSSPSRLWSASYPSRSER